VSALQTFVLPERLEAHEPPEARGLERDEVRMLVTERASGRVRDLRAREDLMGRLLGRLPSLTPRASAAMGDRR